MRFSLLVVALLLGVAAARGEVTAWPGGVARFDLGPAEGEAPLATYGDKRILVAEQDGRWLAVLGVHLDTEPGDATITLADGALRSFRIVDHDYREQHLEVAPGYVSLSEANLARVTRERKIIDAALNNWRDAEVASVVLQRPVGGPHSDSFGSRRFFNGEPRSPHSGMDIAAPSGEPVRAPLAGVVTAVGDYYFNGNTVLLDHGRGYVSMYCHLSEIDVIEGQSLATGDRLGRVGATGRVTGAHLHFGTYLNGNAVDPALLLESAP